MSAAPVVVSIELGDRAYPVHLGHDLLGQLGPLLAARVTPGRALVVTHPAIGQRYAEPLLGSLVGAGFAAAPCELTAGERYKRLSSVERIWSAATEQRLDRDGLLIALGGGVLGDMVGFAAACYFRGIRFVQVPTTLLAMVDSSVGGKTGINFHGKNLVGAFWQPTLVLADLDTPRSLPPRELRCGLAEVIKHGAILDLDLFERLEHGLITAPSRDGLRLTPQVALTPDLLALCVERSCRLKAAVVAADEREAGQRAWLNFGHTFGHALEALCGYSRLRHGEAVSIGMVLATRLGVLRGDLHDGDLRRLTALCRAAGLPTQVPRGLDPSEVWTAMQLDKKARAGRLRLTLLERLGQAAVVDNTPDELVQQLLEKACLEG